MMRSLAFLSTCRKSCIAKSQGHFVWVLYYYQCIQFSFHVTTWTLAPTDNVSESYYWQVLLFAHCF